MWFLGLSWGVTMLATVISGLALIVGLKDAKGAPQEAAIAAICLAFVVIPYVFTRAVEGMAMLGVDARARRAPGLDDDRTERGPPPSPRKRAGIDQLGAVSPVFRDGPHDRQQEPGADGRSPRL